MRHLPGVLLALLLVLLGIVGWLAVREAPPNVTGLGHPEYSTMLQGADGAIRHGGLLVVGWVFGATMLALFVGLMLLGLGARAARARLFMLAGGVLVVGAFTGVMVTYSSYMQDPTLALERLFAGLPPPTAWMLYGVWFVPAVFILLYIWKFHTWVWTPDQDAAFKRLIAEGKAAAAATEGAAGEGKETR